MAHSIDRPLRIAAELVAGCFARLAIDPNVTARLGGALLPRRPRLDDPIEEDANAEQGGAKDKALVGLITEDDHSAKYG